MRFIRIYVLLFLLCPAVPALAARHTMQVTDDGRVVCTWVPGSPGESGATHDHQSAAISPSSGRDPEEYSAVSRPGITVLYVGFPNQASRRAFRKGVDNWLALLELNTRITVRAIWKPEDSSALATALTFFSRWRQYEFPNSLANQLRGRDLNGASLDGVVTIYDRDDWYTGTDGLAEYNEFDLVTVVMHELGHVFGFYSGVRSAGIARAKIFSKTGIPRVYDAFLWHQKYGQLTEYGLNTPSRDIYKAVTNDDLLWGNLSHTNWHGEPLLTTEMNGGPVPLLSPGKLTYSSSHHLDYRSYPDDSPDSLMTSGRPSAVTVKSPGPVTLAMLYDMGWELSDAGWEVIETGRPPPPPAVPPMPEIELDVTERGGWDLILVRWDDLPSADHYETRLTSRTGKPIASGTWTRRTQPLNRYSVRRSWGPFLIEVRGVNSDGDGAVGSVMWPEEQIR